MHDIIVFPFHDLKKCQSQGLVRRDTQIIMGLEKIDGIRKILVVDRPVSTPMLVGDALRGGKSFVQGGKLLKRRGTSWLWQLSEKLYVLDVVVAEPFTTLLLQRRWWPHILKSTFFLAQVRKAAQSIDITSPILWLFTPISAPAIGCFDERTVVFDALDNWIEHEGLLPYREASRKGYDAVKAKADLAFCGADYMRGFLSGGKPRTFWVPNGVDTSLFRPLENCAPPEIAEINRPRVGYVGVIDSRIDTSLLEQCAKLLPEMNFVLVGPVFNGRVSVDFLRSMPNVHFLGHKPYEEMPRYINSFDVCLIPHKVNRYTEGMNPLKLYEYLACGKPVVSTPVAGIDAFLRVVKVAEGPECFAGAIVESLVHNSHQGVAERRDSIMEHSWTCRMEFIWTQVQELLKAQDKGD